MLVRLSTHLLENRVLLPGLAFVHRAAADIHTQVCVALLLAALNGTREHSCCIVWYEYVPFVKILLRGSSKVAALFCTHKTENEVSCYFIFSPGLLFWLFAILVDE